MATEPIRCRRGLHSYVTRHPVGERLDGPDHEVCRRCGKEQGSVVDVPPGFLGGGV